MKYDGTATYLKMRHLDRSFLPVDTTCGQLGFGANLAKIFLKRQLSLSINKPKERLKSVARGGWILTVTNEAV